MTTESRKTAPTRCNQSVDLLIPIGDATELPSGFGHLLWDMAVDAAESGRDETEAAE